MNVFVCIKRVPATAGQITLTPDGQEIDTRYLGFTVSPHEECAVEEAVRLTEKHGGSSTVLTLGPEAAIDQLRDAMALGIERALLLETDGREWDPVATSSAIVEAIEAERNAGRTYDLVMFGNESADSAGYQVGVRVADALDLPCVTGIKALEISDGRAMVRRQTESGWEVASRRYASSCRCRPATPSRSLERMVTPARMWSSFCNAWGCSDHGPRIYRARRRITDHALARGAHDGRTPRAGDASAARGRGDRS